MLFESQCCSAFPWEMTAFKHFLQCNKLKIKEVFFNGKLLNGESTWGWMTLKTDSQGVSVVLQTNMFLQK